MNQSRWFLRASMVSCLCLSFLMLKAGCQPANQPQPVQPTGVIKAAIINGAPDLTQPAIGALVVQRRSSFCTGTLITKQLVVTAAHCVDAVNRYGLANITFRTDFDDPNGTFTSEHHELLQAVKHPQYRANTGADYDIAVLVLKQKVTNAKIVPVAPNRNPMNQQWIGTNIRVVGYGLIQTQPNNRSADQKYGADIPLFKIDPRSFIHYDNQTPVQQRKSACHGDSGGPAMYTVGGKQYVMGVTSIAYQANPSGNGSTLCDGGAVSTRLDAHLDFLRPFLIKYSDGPEPCKTNTDCGACSDCSQKLVCEPKQFPTEPTQCKPCKDDADCGTGICYRFATGYRCLQPCTKESCCPIGSACTSLLGTNRSMAVCSPEKDCGDVACSAATDCGPGEKCNAGKCEPDPPPRSPELCHPCKNDNDCNGGICYGPAGNGRCTQKCGAGDFCPSGLKCTSLYPGLPSQCVPESGNCAIPCQVNDHCPTGFECTKGSCSRKGGGIYGDPCDPGPCKDGLTCVSTESGKNCMQVCGVKPTYGGTACSSSNQCSGGARCYRNSSYNVCIASCTNGGNECGTKGGGTCSGAGNCLCREAKDCRNGYFCNYFTWDRGGPVGACVQDDADIKCPSNFECRRFDSGEYCVANGAGVRSVGEPCDSLNRCKEGLACLRTNSGSLCFEDCTTTRKCDLGGSCLQVGRTTRVCLCTSDLNCPNGRSCETAFQGYGICKPRSQGKPAGCIDDKECPPYYKCVSNQCVAGEFPTPEPAAEPKPEPTPEPVTEPAQERPAQDAGPSTPDEPAPTPDTSTPKDDTPTPDTAAPTDTNALNPKPGGGCGCQSTLPHQGPTQLPLSLLLLLLFAGLTWRRQRH